MNAIDDSALVRLLQLCSGSLPVGGFTYSQGIEWAVERGLISNEAGLAGWLRDLLETSLSSLEVPILVRLHRACEMDDSKALRYWSEWLLANRETRELREEECHRGRALASLLIDLEVPRAKAWREILNQCQTAGFALAVSSWRIPLTEAAQGFAWNWLENLCLAGVKLIPLGQTAGQRILFDLGGSVGPAVVQGLQLCDEEIGASAPMLAIASSRHETQYTRLFRS